MYDFLEDYNRVREEKNSVLCVGLDPALPDQRHNNVIQKIYAGDSGDAILQYCLEIVDEVADHCCAIKANSQYILFALNQPKLEILNAAIHEYGLLSILDHKLGDIGSSNESALYWAKKCGFDAITFSPYAGNIREATDMAHEMDLGIFVLDLMSNPEAEGFQKKAKFNNTPIYMRVAEDARHAESDGIVVGATGHVRETELMKIRKGFGDKRIILFPGIGIQGGDLNNAITYGGKNILLNVGRGIIYAPNPREAAEKFNEAINKLR